MYVFRPLESVFIIDKAVCRNCNIYSFDRPSNIRQSNPVVIDLSQSRRAQAQYFIPTRLLLRLRWLIKLYNYGKFNARYSEMLVRGVESIPNALFDAGILAQRGCTQQPLDVCTSALLALLLLSVLVREWEAAGGGVFCIWVTALLLVLCGIACAKEQHPETPHSEEGMRKGEKLAERSDTHFGRSVCLHYRGCFALARPRKNSDAKIVQCEQQDGWLAVRALLAR